MLFKLSFKNMKKSFKDYSIYFITLVLGVAIFYMFNSLDSQQAMLQVSQSQRDIITMMIRMLEFVSVFVAVILGLLIVYANNFLINRRKKEFGIYMTLGMSKQQISKILLGETICIGLISLIIGLLIGIILSQVMSIIVGSMFDADMDKFVFVFLIEFLVLKILRVNNTHISRHRFLRPFRPRSMAVLCAFSLSAVIGRIAPVCMTVYQ